MEMREQERHRRSAEFTRRYLNPNLPLAPINRYYELSECKNSLDLRIGQVVGEYWRELIAEPIAKRGVDLNVFYASAHGVATNDSIEAVCSTMDIGLELGKTFDKPNQYMRRLVTQLVRFGVIDRDCFYSAKGTESVYSILQEAWKWGVEIGKKEKLRLKQVQSSTQLSA